MPPRKSDNARLSNVSMAQFVYDGPDPDTSSASLPPASTPASATPTAASKPKPVVASIEMDSQPPTQPAPPSDKDKDKERKDSKESGSRETVSIEDLNLPKSIITRLAKGVLPPNTQIQANAILAMSKSATVFINHLANAANEKTLNSNKKTIMPADVFDALEDIEFDFMRDRVMAEFKKFNEVQTTKRNTYRRKVAAAKKAEKATTTDPNASMVSTATSQPDSSNSNNAPRAIKKLKPSAPDDSAMDVDGDATEELREPSDAETEPEQDHEEDDEEDDDEAAEDEDEDEEEGGEDEEHDHLEERQPRDEHDDALDDGDSD
ncbi:hypothetical protein M426DRAFT_319790 [Hypoxylon sp. CI-4A]|nr:hypothetical protein M426DRAFT_319790 [Hypoxylon sp. CI-4A]